MTVFPGPGATVYYNEAGEPLGWDYPSEPEYDPDDFLPNHHFAVCDECGEPLLPDGCVCGVDDDCECNGGPACECPDCDHDDCSYQKETTDG